LLNSDLDICTTLMILLVFPKISETPQVCCKSANKTSNKKNLSVILQCSELNAHFRLKFSARFPRRSSPSSHYRS